MSLTTAQDATFNLDTLNSGKVPVMNLRSMDAIKKEASVELASTPFPTTRDEEWRFTNIKAISRSAFVQAAPADIKAVTYDTATVPEAKDSTLVFVNGIYSESLSKVTNIPDGIIVTNLCEAVEKHAALIEVSFNKANNFEKDFFSLLNTAMFEDGAFIYIPKETKFERPIHLVYLTHGHENAASFPRNLIIAERHAEFTVVEEYLGDDDQSYLTTSFTEIMLGEEAHMSHVRLQKDGLKAYHVNRIVSQLQRGADLQSYTVSLGAEIFRNDVRAIMAGEGSHATLDGLVLVASNQLSDTHSIMDHRVANCTSHQLHKTIVDGKATSVFNGKIFVRKDAQKTDAFQENHNLQLSLDGMVYTKPQLEIFADDVKCSHGATVGQTDSEQEFYLRSRGLNDSETKEILTFGFATEVIESLPVDSIKADLRKAVETYTKRGLE
ncbi:MAG: Fe-S cluster assembly protein SufD [Bacteroidetes bacterium]|nr:Fe-S cluster assembly protein SufD [Bacteroidota bacterium]MCH8523609.1 Fe-S cluster assembly protein SufD [Balneolales bacterium]